MDQFVQFLDELERMAGTLRDTAGRCKAKDGSMYRQGLGVGLQRSAEILAAKVAEQQALIELHAEDEPGETEPERCTNLAMLNRVGATYMDTAPENLPANRCGYLENASDDGAPWRCSKPQSHLGGHRMYLSSSNPPMGSPAERCGKRLGDSNLPRCGGPRDHDGDCR